MNRVILHLLSVLLLLSATGANLMAQRVSVAFYNAENFFDTIPSPFGGDVEYTPDGYKRWNAQKYNHKLSSLTRVIDSLGADIMGLCEIENEGVVRDLVANLKQDYCYIIRSTSDKRGLDMALLYKADIFVPDEVSQMNALGRAPLVVKGDVCGRRATFVVCHQPSYFNNSSYREDALKRLKSGVLKLRENGENPIVMGDFNFDTSEAALRRMAYKDKTLWRFVAEFENPIGEKFGSVGSYNYNGRWMLYDNILLDNRLINSSLRVVNSGVFIRDFMLKADDMSSGRKLRRLSDASDHLPVFVVMEFIGKL